MENNTASKKANRIEILEKYELPANRDHALESAAAALATMQRFLDDARRDIARAAEDEGALQGLPQAVAHALAWGQANAVSHVENLTRDVQLLLVNKGRLQALKESL